jgi:hypothetical protein
MPNSQVLIASVIAASIVPTSDDSSASGSDNTGSGRLTAKGHRKFAEGLFPARNPALGLVLGAEPAFVIMRSYSTASLSTRGRGAHSAPSGITTSFRPPRFLNVSEI